jgi:hypothetical protein
MTLWGDESIQKWMRAMPPAFLEWMEQQFNDGMAKLRNADDLLAVGRYQGMLEILAMLKELRKES